VRDVDGTPPVRQVVGARIRQTREARGLTLTQLADRLHVAKQTLSGWENGNHAPGVEELVLVAEILGVSPGYLLGEDHARPPAPPLRVVRWQKHEWHRAQDDSELFAERQFRCPVRSGTTDPHDAIWLTYRSGLVRVVCPDCGEYQVG